MGPKKVGDGGNKPISNYLENEQPVWAKRMEGSISKKIEDVHEAIDFMNSEFEAIRANLKDFEEKMNQEKKSVNDRFVDAEFHNRKYNLLIFGLDLNSGENCEQTVRKFMRSDLKITDSDKMLFANCHPLPESPQGKKACIVRFVCMADKITVLKSCSALKGQKKAISVVTDLPKELREIRRDLQKRTKAMRDEGKVVRVAERGKRIVLEEKDGGKWKKLI